MPPLCLSNAPRVLLGPSSARDVRAPGTAERFADVGGGANPSPREIPCSSSVSPDGRGLRGSLSSPRDPDSYAHMESLGMSRQPPPCPPGHLPDAREAWVPSTSTFTWPPRPLVRSHPTAWPASQATRSPHDTDEGASSLSSGSQSLQEPLSGVWSVQNPAVWWDGTRFPDGPREGGTGARPSFLVPQGKSIQAQECAGKGQPLGHRSGMP